MFRADEALLAQSIIHRIVKVDHDAQRLVLATKRDANAGADVFVTHANDVVGKLAYDVPGLGDPFLFFRSRQGEIFLAAVALIAILYVELGLVEDRRIVIEARRRRWKVSFARPTISSSCSRAQTLKTLWDPL